MTVAHLLRGKRFIVLFYTVVVVVSTGMSMGFHL